MEEGECYAVCWQVDVLPVGFVSTVEISRNDRLLFQKLEEITAKIPESSQGAYTDLSATAYGPLAIVHYLQ